MVQTFTARDRVPFNGKNDVNVPDSSTISSIPIHTYLPSRQDEATHFNEMRTMVKRILVSWIPFFHSIEDTVEWHIDHTFREQSSIKSEMVKRKYIFFLLISYIKSEFNV